MARPEKSTESLVEEYLTKQVAHNHLMTFNPFTNQYEGCHQNNMFIYNKPLIKI